MSSYGATTGRWRIRQPWIKMKIRLNSEASTEVSINANPKRDQPSFGVQTGSIDKTVKAIEKAGGKVITPKH